MKKRATRSVNFLERRAEFSTRPSRRGASPDALGDGEALGFSLEARAKLVEDLRLVEADLREKKRVLQFVRARAAARGVFESIDAHQARIIEIERLTDRAREIQAKLSRLRASRGGTDVTSQWNALFVQVASETLPRAVFQTIRERVRERISQESA